MRNFDVFDEIIGSYIYFWSDDKAVEIQHASWDLNINSRLAVEPELHDPGIWLRLVKGKKHAL